MKRKMKWFCIVVAAVVLFSLSSTAFGDKPDSAADDKTLAPYFFIEGGESSAEQFPLKETQVTANISGAVADIYVVQTYSNDGTWPINANYVFPASNRVSVHGMKMEIGDKSVTAKIKEREDAKQEFEQAKAEGKSASLLEQQRPNVFTMSVANIMPGDMVRIELHYTELIVPAEGVYRFVFPTVVGPRYSNQSAANAPDSDKWVESPYLKDGRTPPGEYGITVNLSTGVPIQELKCSSHNVDVSWNSESASTITLAGSEEFAGNRDFILDYRLTGQKVQCGMMLYEGGDENFFMLTVQPPERVKLEEIPPREYIFILDVSGSMNGYPLDTAKGLIMDLVTHLRNTDKFNLVLFAGASSIMSPSSVPATEENIRQAVELIERQDGGGGTELLPALKRALSVPRDENVSRSVVIITDGYISGEQEIFDLINENLNKTDFFSFGIGTSVNRYLIEGIAKAGQGEPFVVTKLSEAPGVAGLFRDYIQSPVLTDIHVEFDGFDAYDIEPPILPSLFAQRPITLFGKWRGEPLGTILVSGKSGNGDFAQDIQVSETATLEANSAISYLWARSRVARLLDYGFGNNNPDVKGEVTGIGLKYSLLTPYTSFVAVIDEIRNKEGKSTDVDQPLPLPLHVSNLAVGGGYTQGSEPGMALIAVGTIALLLSITLWRRRILAAIGGMQKEKTAAE